MSFCGDYKGFLETCLTWSQAHGKHSIHSYYYYYYRHHYLFVQNKANLKSQASNLSSKTVRLFLPHRLNQKLMEKHLKCSLVSIKEGVLVYRKKCNLTESECSHSVTSTMGAKRLYLYFISLSIYLYHLSISIPISMSFMPISISISISILNQPISISWYICFQSFPFFCKIKTSHSIVFEKKIHAHYTHK